MELQIKRHLVQLCTTILYNANGIMPITGEGTRLSSHKVCVPGLNCQYCHYSIAGCPLGITQQAISGGFSAIAWQAWGLMVLFALLLGRLVCGFACPIGFFQDLLDRLPLPKLKKSKLTYYLSYLKYLIGAIFVIGLPLYSGHFSGWSLPAFCQRICPGSLVEAVIIPSLLRGSWASLDLVLRAPKFYWVLLLVIAMVFIYRPFCRFICPLGAFYGFFNKFALLGMRVDNSLCINCKACIRVCKMDTKQVGDHECIGCGRCIGSCPTKAISYKPFKK